MSGAHKNIDDFIKGHSEHIELLEKRIEQFKEIGLDHWIPIYEQHKKDAELLLEKALKLKQSWS